MLKLRDGIVELYRKAATSIPADVEEALRNALAAETSVPARETLNRIIDNIRASRQIERPVCHDTGVPVFHIRAPRGLSHNDLRNTVREATVIATEKELLQPNAIDVITNENTGNNVGIGFPIIYVEETADDRLKIDLLMKTSGCENVSQLYRLPVEDLGAGMDLEGVRLCVLDAVRKAEGRGCPPYTIGVGVGAAFDQVAVLATFQLFRRLTDTSEYPVIAALEERLLREINSIGPGPAGPDMTVNAIGVKIGINHRHTSSYCVGVSVSCWASRRARLIW